MAPKNKSSLVLWRIIIDLYSQWIPLLVSWSNGTINMIFIKKLNFRLIGVHLLATLFLLLGAERFSLLCNLDLIETYRKYGSLEYLDHLSDTGRTAGEIFTYLFYADFFATLLALIISFIISLKICQRRQIYWLNSLFVLIIGILLNRFDFLAFAGIKTLTEAFGNLFISYGLKYVLIINGLLLMSIGVGIYFNNWTMKFIQKQHQ